MLYIYTTSVTAGPPTATGLHTTKLYTILLNTLACIFIYTTVEVYCIILYPHTTLAPAVSSN